MSAKPSVLVCRGGCCGTERKLPDVDHDAHLDRLRDAVDGVARVRVVDCLGPCERANVTVVRLGAQRRWFGMINDNERIDALAAWIRSSAPTPPAWLEPLEIASSGDWVTPGDGDRR